MMSRGYPVVVGMLDPVLLVLGGIGLAVDLGVFYYALRLLLIMRRGLLETSWRYISAGAILAGAGMFFFFIYHAAMPEEQMLHDLSFSLLEVSHIVGGALILLGLRAHYKVWKPTKAAIL